MITDDKKNRDWNLKMLRFFITKRFECMQFQYIHMYIYEGKEKEKNWRNRQKMAEYVK